MRDLFEKPTLNSLEERKKFYIKFILYILAAIFVIIIGLYNWIETCYDDVPVLIFCLMLGTTLINNGLYYYHEFNGRSCIEDYLLSKVDLDELFEFGKIDDPEEEKRQRNYIKRKQKEYFRIGKILWEIELLKYKKEKILKKNKFKAKKQKKIKKLDKQIDELQKQLKPRMDGIKI